ncbi:unnamed protein product [Rhizophagus irregularis]|nr:unnamed protein product [Rhizophagus irregularis]
MEKGRDKTHNEYENLEKVLCNKYVSLKDFSSGDPVSSDDEYEDLEKTWRILKKFLEGVIEESSIQSELNNDSEDKGQSQTKKGLQWHYKLRISIGRLPGPGLRKETPSWTWILAWAMKAWVVKGNAFLNLDFSLDYERDDFLDLDFGLGYIAKEYFPDLDFNLDYERYLFEL